MPKKQRTDAPPIARAIAALASIVFCLAAFSWAALATMGIWAAERFHLRIELRDVIPALIAVTMLLIAFQFARDAIVPSELPWGIGKPPRPVPPMRFAAYIVGATVIVFMGFVLWNWSGAYGDYFVYNAQGQVAGLSNPMPDWMRPLQRASGVGLMLVGCFALVMRTLRFVEGRHV